MEKKKQKFMNKFSYTFDNKRYHTFNYYVKTKFKSKVFKVSLNAGFTCPNRDGSKGVGGCSFCSDVGSGDYAGDAKQDLATQFDIIKNRMHQKWDAAKYIGYFQAFTNTYAPVEYLRSLYEDVLSYDGVVGLHIATRADCIDDKLLEYLKEINVKTDLWIELGLQSSNDKTAININRGHTFSEFKETVQKLKSSGIKVCAHIINGLPGETSENMLQTVKDLNTLEIDGVKIHMLHVIKDTAMHKQYEKDKFKILTREEYVEITVSQLRLLRPECVIFRITGDAVKEDLIVPQWTLRKVEVINEIDKYMAKLDIYQGDMVV